jgi:hypothetical protein
MLAQNQFITEQFNILKQHSIPHPLPAVLDENTEVSEVSQVAENLLVAENSPNVSLEQTELTTKGLKRSRAVNTSRHSLCNNGMILLTNDNTTAREFWDEFQYGRNGGPVIRELEDKSKEWRSDPKRSSMKACWSNRSPIYNYIIYLMSLGDPELIAVEETQKVFDEIGHSKKNKPQLSKIAKRLRQIMKGLGVYDSRAYK